MIPPKIKDNAEAVFKKRPRIGEGPQILAKIQADRLVDDEKIERLKSLRLARGAAAQPAPAKPKEGGD